MITTTAKVKSFFFDSKKVVNAVDKATRSALSKAGAFIRQSAQTSMRRRKKASAPGKPPSVHVGTLKKLLLFRYDPATKSVVVGPVPFGPKAEAPRLNEHGGRAVRRKRGGGKRMVTYPPRPYMLPALLKESPKLPTRWANSVKSGA